MQSRSDQTGRNNSSYAHQGSSVNSEFKVLVVEDDSNDFEMLHRSLRKTRMFDLTWERCAVDGLAELDKARYDVVLLDLTLPDSKGLESVDMFTSNRSTPVVVLSGIDDENTALESVQHGAQDYVVKGKFDTTLISRTLRYAIERFRLLEALREAQQLVRREQELRRLNSDASSPSHGESPSVGELNPLKTTQVEFFSTAVIEYDDLINRALELREFKIEDNLSTKLRALANSMGAYKASPRDAVDVHTTALNKKIVGLSARRSSLCNEEARYLLIGLLGHLCLFYQGKCASASVVTTAEVAIEHASSVNAVSENG